MKSTCGLTFSDFELDLCYPLNFDFFPKHHLQVYNITHWEKKYIACPEHYSGDLEMTSGKKSKFNEQHESNSKSENVVYVACLSVS